MIHSRSLSRSCSLIMTLGSLACMQIAAAADHDNLEAGFPTSVVDAYPIHYRALEAQLALGYQKPDDTDGGLVIMPRFEVGAAPNLQLGAGVTFITDGNREHSGDITVDALYNFNQESLWWPALAIAGEVALPTGKGSQGVRTNVMAILTKGIIPWWSDRWHVNVGWEFLSDADNAERDRRFQAVLGYSRPLSTDMVLVIDGVRRQGEDNGSPWETAAELGLRRQLTPLAVISLGGGLDFADHAGYTGIRVTAGLQHSF